MKNALSMPTFKKGMIVVSPCTIVPYITEDKKYIILDIDDQDFILITDDTGEEKYYQSHLFIEANVYYTMIMWLSTIRLFDIKTKKL